MRHIVMGIHVVIYFFRLLFFFKLISLINEKHLYFMQFTILGRYECMTQLFLYKTFSTHFIFY